MTLPANSCSSGQIKAQVRITLDDDDDDDDDVLSLDSSIDERIALDDDDDVPSLDSSIDERYGRFKTYVVWIKNKNGASEWT
ncbi:hypothetical protein Tco_1493224 [Tanacetum coccineum]